MTGYGKAEAQIQSGKLTLEIRTLNSKSADINIKTSLLPKDKDLEVRKRLAEKLVRGTIDLDVSYEANASEAAHSINADAFHDYWKSAVAALDKETLLAKACDTPTAIPCPSPITMKNIGNITLTAARASTPMDVSQKVSIMLFALCMKFEMTIGIAIAISAFLGSPSMVLASFVI